MVNSIFNFKILIKNLESNKVLISKLGGIDLLIPLLSNDYPIEIQGKENIF